MDESYKEFYMKAISGHIQWIKEFYMKAISGHIQWIKENIEKSPDGQIRLMAEDVKKETSLELISDNSVYYDLKLTLFEEGIVVNKGRHLTGKMVYIFRMVTPEDIPPFIHTRGEETVPGINEIRVMENFNDFCSEKVVEATEKHKDIIKEVDRVEDDTIDIYLMSGVGEQKLIIGIIDIIEKFDATEISYNESDNSITFWWN